ncbi:hypothetical protein OAT10_02295, partial [Luminiphilus sp.]|nr:hypothetical protein [Luminiphilus sp.]
FTAGELRRAGALLLKDGFDPSFESATPNAKMGVNFGDLFLLDRSELGIYAATKPSSRVKSKKKFRGVR